MLSSRACRFWCLFLCLAVPCPAQNSVSISKCQPLRIFRSDAKDDRLGFCVSGAGDVNADGFPDVLIGAPFHDPGTLPTELDSGAAYLLFGAKLALLSGAEIDLATMEENGILMVGAVGAQAGATLAGVGDINQDGMADFAVGTGRGYQATLMFGSSSYPKVFQLNSHSEKNITLINTGASVARAGDVNGDGFSDALFGNPYAELAAQAGKESYLGKAFLLFGGRTITQVIDGNNPGDTGPVYVGAVNELFGRWVGGVGDVNADGFDDFVLTSGMSGTGTGGISRLFFGSKDNPFPSQSRAEFTGAGGPASEIGDLNADGYDDFLLCSRDYRVVLVWGKADLAGTVDLNGEIPPAMGSVFMGAVTAAGVGDINADGFRDLAFGLPYQPSDGLEGAGQVVIVFGSSAWPPVVDLLSPQVRHVIIGGAVASGGFSSSLAGVGDIEVDGYADLIIGAPSDGIDSTGKEIKGG
ncbi:MAG TPA: hypothetical protein PLZ55_16275, partial [bacterium]|nr:hypothetical protein [bacterium]